jgi:hypothetical protein
VQTKCKSTHRPCAMTYKPLAANHSSVRFDLWCQYIGPGLLRFLSPLLPTDSARFHSSASLHTNARSHRFWLVRRGRSYAEATFDPPLSFAPPPVFKGLSVYYDKPRRKALRLLLWWRLDVQFLWPQEKWVSAGVAAAHGLRVAWIWELARKGLVPTPRFAFRPCKFWTSRIGEI